MSRRRVGVFTSGRQDWWILEPVVRAVADHPGLEVAVFLAGTHFLDAFGRTERLVRQAGWPVVDVPPGAAVDETNPFGAAALAELAGSLVRAMERHRVDVMVVLGDRIETLAAAVMVVAARTLLAHIHGGDRAPGEFDDAARHAISKLAHVHFAATSGAAERLARLGESPGRIHLVGSPSIDGVLADGSAEEAQARDLCGLTQTEPYAVVLYHPAGLGDEGEARAVTEVCEGVAAVGLRAVCLGPNGDPGREAVWKALRDFSSARDWPIVPTVDRRVFLRLIASAVALVGNSSAGFVESAAVNAVVVNVGPRQCGREHSGNVVHLAARREEVAAALRRLQGVPEVAADLRAAPCVYGDGRSAGRIAEVLARMDLSASARIKLNEY